MRKTIHAVTKVSFTITANFLTQSLGYYFCSQQENRHLHDAMARVKIPFRYLRRHLGRVWSRDGSYFGETKSSKNTQGETKRGYNAVRLGISLLKPH